MGKQMIDKDAKAVRNYEEAKNEMIRILVETGLAQAEALVAVMREYTHWLYVADHESPMEMIAASKPGKPRLDA